MLDFDAFGSPSSPPLLLISGLGVQRIEGYEDGLCQQFAAAGFHAARFENRDARQDLEVSAAYTLDDMADDALAAINTIFHSTTVAVHVLGTSMGGMIAQLLAIKFPARVKTLTSVMSSMAPFTPAKPELLAEFNVAPPTDEAGFVDRRVRLVAALNNNPANPIDEARVKKLAKETFARGPSYPGFLRQHNAINSSGSRAAALAMVTLPALVLHGDVDPLISIDAGKATADTIPGAKFVPLPGLGHYLHPSVWSSLASEVKAVAGV